MLVKEAIGKYINPTRYRQIIETESSTRLTLTEQVFTATIYQEISPQKGRCASKKMVGNSRTHEENQLSNLLSTINSNNMLFDQSVVDHTVKLLGSSAYPISAVTDEGQPENNTTWIQNENSGVHHTNEVIITGSVEAPSPITNMDKCESTSAPPLTPINSNDIAFQILPDYATVATSSPNSPCLFLDCSLLSDTKNICVPYTTNDAVACQ